MFFNPTEVDGPLFKDVHSGSIECDAFSEFQLACQNDT